MSIPACRCGCVPLDSRCGDIWEGCGKVITDGLDRIPFNISSDSAPSKVDQLFCEMCGSDKFYVGRDICFTAIKCIRCDHEEAVHDG